MQITPEDQYRETYESWRQHDRFIWQTPSIIVVVAGALIGASFALEIPWWAREFIIGFALILSIVLTFALIKHRYFIDLEQATLTHLEKEYAIKRIQRMSSPSGNKEEYYESKKANWFLNLSAHRVFKWGMYLICSALLFLLLWNWRMGTLDENGQATICPRLWWTGIGIYAALVITALVIVILYSERKPNSDPKTENNPSNNQ